MVSPDILINSTRVHHKVFVYLHCDIHGTVSHEFSLHFVTIRVIQDYCDIVVNYSVIEESGVLAERFEGISASRLT